MPRPLSGETKTYNINRSMPKGVIYVYRRTEKYDPEIKRMKKAGKDVLVGKILPENPGAIVPTRPRRKGAAMSESAAQIRPDAEKPAHSASETATAPHPSARRFHIGAGRLLDRAAEISGIEDDIYQLTDKGTAQKLISCARFLVSTGGDRLSHMATWQIMHPIPYEEGMSKDICHRLTESLGVDETFRQSLFQRRFMRQAGDDALVVAFDGSTVSTYSENQAEARHGFNKDHNGLPTIKWLALYASESCSPLAFAKQPGNVPDVVSVSNALSQLSVLTDRDIVLVTDNGFYSEGNVYELMERNYGFLMRIGTDTKWVRPYLEKHMAELEASSRSCSADGYVTGMTVPIVRTFIKADDDGTRHTVRKKCHLHFFLDSRKRASMNAAGNVGLQELMSQLNSGVALESLSREGQDKARKFLRSRTEKDGRTVYVLNEYAVRKSRESNGVFALLGHGKYPVVKDTRAAFSTYINREHIEDHFRAEKQTVDGNTVRSWYGDNYMGRMVIQFVALCYEDCLWQSIRSIKGILREDIAKSKIDGRNKTEASKKQKLLTWLNGMSLKDIICWFDAIEVTEVSTQVKEKRWNTEVLERDRLFLQLLGVEI